MLFYFVVDSFTVLAVLHCYGMQFTQHVYGNRMEVVRACCCFQTESLTNIWSSPQSTNLGSGKVLIPNISISFELHKLCCYICSGLILLWAPLEKNTAFWTKSFNFRHNQLLLTVDSCSNSCPWDGTNLGCFSQSIRTDQFSFKI